MSGPRIGYALARSHGRGHCGLPTEELQAFAAKLSRCRAKVVDAALPGARGWGGGGRHARGAPLPCSSPRLCSSEHRRSAVHDDRQRRARRAAAWSKRPACHKWPFADRGGWIGAGRRQDQSHGEQQAGVAALPGPAQRQAAQLGDHKARGHHMRSHLGAPRTLSLPTATAANPSGSFTQRSCPARRS